jgi:hypothetical protein
MAVPSGEDEMIDFKSFEEYQKHARQYCMEHGIYWHITATMLKTAADKILEVHLNAVQRYTNLKEEDGYLVTDDYYISIHNEMRLFPVYMLLMGYAIENCVKGIIICGKWLQEPNSIKGAKYEKLNALRKGKRGHVRLKSHNLIGLFDAEVVNINLSPPEQEMLEELRKSVVYNGRYPIPLDLNDYSSSVVWIPDKRPKIINGIYDKTILELDRLSKLQSSQSK